MISKTMLSHEKDDGLRTLNSGEKSSVVEHKVVICYLDGRRVRGHLRTEAATSIDTLLQRAERTLEAETIFCPLDGEPHTLELSQAKALFFVKTFEGNPRQEKIRFYENGPEVGLLWVEIQFQDGEVEEGAIYNSIHHLVQSGFFLQPSDPGSNNRLIYVNKSAITGYRVLGVRAMDSGLLLPDPTETHIHRS
jgi:hypothetical protein